MRFLVMVKGVKDTGKPPRREDMAEMGKFNEELEKAGVLLDANGLHSGQEGVRITFGPNRKTRVVDGPFAESQELVAGFWLWQVRSKDEAIEWAKRAPFEDGNELEIRQVYEQSEFE